MADEMPHDTTSAAEVARLRESLQALAATSGKTIIRVELEIAEHQTLIRVTAPTEQTEGAIGSIVLSCLEAAGYRRADKPRKKGGKRG